MTDFVYEISCTGDRGRQDAVRAWFATHAAPAWTGLPCLSALDAYEAVESGARDPFVSDGRGPLLHAMLHFPTLDAMLRGIGDGRLAESLAGVADVALTGTMFERRPYPVTGEHVAGPSRATFSYVVRYHRPAQDEAAFVANYLASHPPLLAKLPRIRSVVCYLPVPAPGPHAIPAADYMIGNEVMFDSVDDFNAAMASPAREEARRHFHSFPPFTGASTHHAMRRRRLAPAQAIAS